MSANHSTTNEKGGGRGDRTFRKLSHLGGGGGGTKFFARKGDKPEKGGGGGVFV